MCVDLGLYAASRRTASPTHYRLSYSGSQPDLANSPTGKAGFDPEPAALEADALPLGHGGGGWNKRAGRADENPP